MQKLENNINIAPCFLPELLHIFKIPINNSLEYVFMIFNNSLIKDYTPVIIKTDTFLDVWGDSPKFSDPPFEVGVSYAKTPQLWKCDRNLNKGTTEKGFSYGIIDPVPLAKIHMINNNKLYLLDGITRTLWLLLHQVKAFPIACPNSFLKEFNSLYGSPKGNLYTLYCTLQEAD